LPSGPEALLGRRQKGGIPLFGKEGLGEIFGSICLLNYGLLGKWEMKNEMNSVIGLLGNWSLFGGWDLVLGI